MRFKPYLMKYPYFYRNKDKERILCEIIEYRTGMYVSVKTEHGDMVFIHRWKLKKNRTNKGKP